MDVACTTPTNHCNQLVDFCRYILWIPGMLVTPRMVVSIGMVVTFGLVVATLCNIWPKDKEMLKYKSRNI